jgi:2-polyprenyl-3-methyl-5-hydroxy-6-metoxy-1,4-benzoquinol methylase
MPLSQQDVADLRAKVEGNPGGWYHTFEFPGGVVTEGFFDHRPILHRLPFPTSLAGKRCLDLASSDGLFAFEMARRGGEVWSVDLDDTTQQDWQADRGGIDRTRGQGRARRAFEIARSALGLHVERVNMNIYDVSPEELGQFDYVFMGNILLHLSDPGRALKAARSVTAGSFLSFEVISLTLSLLQPFTPAAQLAAEDGAQQWWTANLAGQKRLLAGAGFEVVESRFPLFQHFGPYLQNQRFRPVLPWRSPQPYGQHLAFWLFWRPFGVPSAWALCR